MKNIVVVDYDPQWAEVFEALRDRIWGVVGDFAISVEHVGSTSVPGLPAKPVIDMSVVVAGDIDVARAIAQLATLGYRHVGNLGIEGREAFKNPDGLPRHHLYVCPQGSLGLRNHLAFRDYLRSHPDEVKTYGELKKSLALQHPHDIDAYIDGKTDFIVGILSKMGITSEDLNSIATANRQS